MRERYDAFLSYSHRSKEWVEVLRRNLESCLKAAGWSGRVFLDTEDLVSGRSWITQLQQGLDRSDQVVLVVTPEALASERVMDEWEGLIAQRPDWQHGRLHLAMLVETPLPPFLKPLQFVDFQEAGEAKYRNALRKLLVGLIDGDARNIPELPAKLEIPPPSVPGLPSALRARLVAWLVPVLERAFLRGTAANCLGLNAARLEGQPSWECAASAALVWSTGNEAPILAALRIVGALAKGFEGYDTEALAALGILKAELLTLREVRPETGLLDRWLLQVATDHERLVPFQEKAQLELLDRVFVQLDLRPDDRLSVEAKEGALLDRPLSLLDVLHLRREESSWITGRWVVLGDPGSGKTTLLRHLTRTLALDDARPWVPLYDSLPRLLRDRYSLFERAVRRMEKVAGQPAQGLESALRSAGEAGRLLFLLDGLDEVPRENREEAEELLRGFSLQWPQTPIVVTSRPIGYRRPGSEFREVDLLPLDLDRRRALLANWFGRATGQPDMARADRALQTLDVPELRDLASNPLYLTLMALLFEQEKEPDRHRTGLYDQVFDLLLDGKHREGAQPMERKEVVREILRLLAFGMTEDNRDSEPVDKLDDRLYRPEMEGLRKKLEQVARWRQSTRLFLDDLADKSGILGAHDGPDAEWRFWHRTFREALTAERLAEEYRQKSGQQPLVRRAKAITAKEDLSRWAEPFALLAGQVDDPDALVLALIEVNRPLGLRALATAQRLKDETLRAALALSEDWEKRAKVYRRLPELVGDPGRALALLSQLWERTRNGNDLFFLHEAVEAVGRRSPDHASEARRVLVQFYERIGRPPEAPFRWVETRDGKVELWKAIPPGPFRMGSSKWEGGHNHEGPMHEVMIASSFQIGAVPVTQGQYLFFDPGHRSHFEGRISTEELALHPVDSVTFYEAVSFCRWLAWVFPWARGARLPAEEEWEYACRAGTATHYWKGNTLKDLAEVGWYRENSGHQTHRVGEKPSNFWGLYDLHGNVWEWTASLITESYVGREGGVTHSPETFGIPGLEESTSGDRRVARGGGFASHEGGARSAYRLFRNPGIGREVQGFRVVLPVARVLGS